jgi:hypothetical protein
MAIEQNMWSKKCFADSKSSNMIHKAIIHIMYNPPVSSTVVTRSQLVPTQLLPFVQAQWNQIIYEATFEQ